MPADLFVPYQLGSLTLANRLVMAPLTRNRAAENGVVPPMMVTHYRQRADAHFGYFLAQLSTRGLAYVHVIEGDMMTKLAGTLDYRALKSEFDGTYIANNGYDLERAASAVRTGSADLVSFGAPFLANPDLVRRYRENLPLNVPDPSTFYTRGETGYNDYPVYTGAEVAA